MSSPNIPDPAQGAAAGMSSEIKNFPATWLINTLAQTGGKATIGGKEYDFTGLGNAAQEYAISNQVAQALLDIQKNFGADYINQRIAELKAADPNGYAARKQLFDLIQQEAKSAPPNAKMSSDLESRVNSMLENAGKLDDQGRREIQNSVRGRQAARGIVLGNAPAAEEAKTMVEAQDNLRTQQQEQAKSYLASGLTPEDIQFRKIQQDLANLGAFQNNQTPQAQFSQLSGSSSGAAPFAAPNYSTPNTINPLTTANIGQGLQQGLYQTSQSQANPWLAGASLGMNALNTASNFGLFNPSWTAGAIPAGTMTTQAASYSPSSTQAMFADSPFTTT